MRSGRHSVQIVNTHYFDTFKSKAASTKQFAMIRDIDFHDLHVKVLLTCFAHGDVDDASVQ